MIDSDRFSQGYALVIGVGSYQHLKSAPQTAIDAKAVAEILCHRDYCRYPSNQVVLLCNGDATRERFVKEMEYLQERVTKDDTVFMFYSGHGEDDSTGEYNLTAFDTQVTRVEDKYKVTRGTGVRHSELLTMLSSIKAMRMLLIFNACHSGEMSPVLDGSAAPELTRPMPRVNALELLATGEGRIIITACREDQYSYIGMGEKTIFGEALVEALTGRGLSSRNGYISAYDLYIRVHDRVQEELPKQTTSIQRQQYGEKQEPMLSVVSGVGEFAVALFPGASVLGEFASLSELPESAGVNPVPKRELPIRTDVVWAMISQTLPDSTDLIHFVLANWPQLARKLTGSYDDMVNFLVQRFYSQQQLSDIYDKLLTERSQM